tara:strand:+ start:291 stop:512 length:222 start_codon:yes stop_codon:yes gene_type:complete
MELKVTITQEQHDVMLSQLRKDENGDDDLTCQEWLQEAIDGKVANCQKRADPVAVLEAEKAALQAKIQELESK